MRIVFSQETEEFTTGNANDYTPRFYNGFRWYRPALGRYTQADPLDYGNGAFNLYLYANNNPINYGDPTGLCGVPPWLTLAVTLAIAGGVGAIAGAAAFGGAAAIGDGLAVAVGSGASAIAVTTAVAAISDAATAGAVVGTGIGVGSVIAGAAADFAGGGQASPDQATDPVRDMVQVLHLVKVQATDQVPARTRVPHPVHQETLALEMLFQNQVIMQLPEVKLLLMTHLLIQRQVQILQTRTITIYTISLKLKQISFLLVDGMTKTLRIRFKIHRV